MSAVEKAITGNASFAPSRLPRIRKGHEPVSLDIVLPVAALVFIVFACVVLPFAYPLPPPVGGNVLEASLPFFSPGHFLGTDMNGNDNLSRALHGGRASLMIALAVNFIGLSLGGFIGALGGYLGGIVDALIMRTLDVLISFPPLVLVLAVGQVLGPAKIHTIAALAFFSVPAFARIARAATLRLRDQPFITAAVLSGSGTGRIVLSHVAPNVLPQLVGFALLGMGIVITIEGGMSFLGLGIRPPEASWGNMIFQGQQSLLTSPQVVAIPGTLLLLTVLSFNLLGEAMRKRWTQI